MEPVFEKESPPHRLRWNSNEYSRLYIGILNEYDLISSKLIRGTGVDFEDCLLLVKSRLGNIDLELLVGHYRKLVSYDIAEARVGVHIDRFIEILRQEKLYG